MAHVNLDFHFYIHLRGAKLQQKLISGEIGMYLGILLNTINVLSHYINKCNMLHFFLCMPDNSRSTLLISYEPDYKSYLISFTVCVYFNVHKSQCPLENSMYSPLGAISFITTLERVLIPRLKLSDLGARVIAKMSSKSSFLSLPKQPFWEMTSDGISSVSDEALRSCVILMPGQVKLSEFLLSFQPYTVDTAPLVLHTVQDCTRQSCSKVHTFNI